MIRKIAVTALAALALVPAHARGAEPPKRVLVVAAHPDDELFMAPAIAALARQGHAVTVLFATTGDQGPGVSGLAPGASLGEIRRAEAFCSTQALGAQMLFLEGLGDGTLAEDAQARTSSGPRFIDQFASNYVGLDPQLVLTWGPDGGYGHADHRMVSAQVTMALQSLAGEYRAQLLYVGIPAGTLPQVPQMAGWAETDPALLSETVRYTPADLAAATTAAMCHQTQFDLTTRGGMMPLFDATIWRGRVHFRPAF